MTKPLFLLDCDGVIADFQSAVASIITPQSLNLTTWDFTEHFDDATRALYKAHTVTPGFAASMPGYRGAKTAVRQLRKLCDVVVVTAPLKHAPTWCHDRKLWLSRCFDIQASDVIFTSRKDLVVGDFLLDDKFENIEVWDKMWSRMHNDGHQRALLWANQPHHEQHRPDPVVGSTYAYITSWQQLLDHVADTIRHHAVPIRGRDFH